MSTKVYNKLVRDHIPAIIEADGKTCITEILSEEAYIEMLDAKLNEELKEYQESKEIEELADLLEVMQAVARARGYSLEKLEQIRQEKADKRGGFEKRILLKEVTGAGIDASPLAVDIANRINNKQEAIINHLNATSMESYCVIQGLLSTVNVDKDTYFRKKFVGFYRMRFVTQEYRDAFFALFEAVKNKKDVSFAEISEKLYPISNQHEFSFISKMMHTINPNSPIYDNQVAKVLELKRKQNVSLKARIEEDNMILNKISKLYEELEESHLIDNAIDAFSSKFSSYPMLTSKKIDFILWALGSGKI